MRNRSFFPFLICGLAVGLTALASSDARGDWVVAAGYDLLQTQAGTTFNGVNFIGVPLNTYNFGGTIGSQSVDNTDTIIQRLSAVSVSQMVNNSGTTALQVDALQLKSTAPTTAFGTLNGQAAYAYVTLDPIQPSGSMMMIGFYDGNNGFFNSMLNINIDIHLGSLTGPVTFQRELMLSQSGASWSGTPPVSGTPLINGVNYNLPGTPGDFFPGAFAEAQGPSLHHLVQPASLPEPSTWIMLASAGLIVPVYTRWGRRRAWSSNAVG